MFNETPFLLRVSYSPGAGIHQPITDPINADACYLLKDNHSVTLMIDHLLRISHSPKDQSLAVSWSMIECGHSPRISHSQTLGDNLSLAEDFNYKGQYSTDHQLLSLVAC